MAQVAAMKRYVLSDKMIVGFLDQFFDNQQLFPNTSKAAFWHVVNSA